MTDVRVVYVTAPTAEVAESLARALVGEGLAACVNLLPGIRSIYRWEGAVQDEAEVLLIVKTVAERLPALTARVIELHPYDVPEVVALPVEAGFAPYLDWIRVSTRG